MLHRLHAAEATGSRAPGVVLSPSRRRDQEAKTKVQREELSATQFVVRPYGASAAQGDLPAIEDLARVVALQARTPGWLATLLEPPASAKAGWALLQARLGGACDVIPVLRTNDGAIRYPTGMLALRFTSPTSDEELEQLAREHGLELVGRASFTRQQALFRAARGAGVFLPDLSDDLSRAERVQASWLDAESPYRRQR